MLRLFKYSLLRYLPGRLGRRYERRFGWMHARSKGFEQAIRLSQGKTCIDLGANVGEYTRKMAAGTKRVIAFEPDPWAHAALEANVADLHNVLIVNAAAGICDEHVLLYRHAQFEQDPALYSESSSVIVSKINVAEDGAIQVRQMDFIQYLEALDEDIGVLKIDIEGAEVDLLEALFDRPDILERIDYIFAETHETRIPGHQLRVEVLQKTAKRMKRPRINLYWN